ncbi:hypothetical protein F5Y16DRAFT_424041 [Xylariaceae sp. FL0255]|nr:hypothetical protein F5Y16DRAFT_424041 [Xylariaceae sp. FL0255]
MGAYVSISQCAAHYNVTLDCDITDASGQSFDFNGTWPVNVSIGGITKGEFQSNPDIAGIGILGVFVGVTSFALLLSILDVGWQAMKTLGWKRKKENVNHKSFSDIVEDIVLTCSDQQVFVGAAYALTLRYWTGCTVSAYHYNIVANMLLLTCVTHLMSVTIVRNYWKFPWLSLIRIASIGGVFIVTGLLFTNQNATAHRFPTDLPLANETDSLMFLGAACFEDSSSTAVATFQDSTKSPDAFFVNTIENSTPDNKIHGWNWYVLTLLYYGAAIIVESIRFIRRSARRKGWRGRLGQKARRCCTSRLIRLPVEWMFLIYLLGGIVISAIVVFKSSTYIFDLRSWVANSGWIQVQNGLNPEDDWTSFGQAVPILTSGLILFTFLQIISDKETKRHNRAHAEEEARPQAGTIQYLDPSNYDLLTPGGGKTPMPDKAGTGKTGYFDIEAAPAATIPPPQIHLDHQSSWGSEISIPNPIVATGTSTPMLTTASGASSRPAAAVPISGKRISTSSASPPRSHRAGSSSGYTAVPTAEPPDSEPGTAVVSLSNPDLNRHSWLPSSEPPTQAAKPSGSSARQLI